MVSFRLFRWFRFGCSGGFGGFVPAVPAVPVVSVVPVIPFRRFRFGVSGFSTCPLVLLAIRKRLKRENVPLFKLLFE